MTTYDPKYKHKPSEKHTLEEVLKSLQDLIRNDLPEDKSAGDKPGSPATDAGRSEGEFEERGEQRPTHEHSPPVREDFAPSNPASGPVNFDAVMRSLRDLINNELDVGDQPAPVDAQAGQPRLVENIPEDDGAPEAEPTFEDPDELKIDDETISSGGQPASFVEPPETDESIAGELEALDDALSFEDTDALNVGEALVSSEEPGLLPDESAADEKPVDEFAPPDDTATFEGSTEISPPPSAESAVPEPPGETSPELLDESELAKPAVVPAPVKEEITAPGTQQEFFLGEPEPSVVEHSPSSRHFPEEPTVDLDTVPLTEYLPPEVGDEPATENSHDMSGEALPTIDVEETFDESAYLEAEARRAPSRPSENQENQNIIASTPVTPVTPAESDTTPANSEYTPEIARESITEIPPSEPTVGFDAIEYEPPQTESHDFPVTTESPAPISESPPAQAEPPVTGETLEKTGTTAEESPVAEEKTESAAEPEQVQAPDDTTSAPTANENLEMTSDSVEELGEPPSSDLDDIPVLKEVVAPPAGRGRVPEEEFPPTQPRLPAPDRARNIVVRAVAKLNVEMRKSGGAGLDTKTILRLQKLIRQELEKDGEK